MFRNRIHILVFLYILYRKYNVFRLKNAENIFPLFDESKSRWNLLLAWNYPSVMCKKNYIRHSEGHIFYTPESSCKRKLSRDYTLQCPRKRLIKLKITCI